MSACAECGKEFRRRQYNAEFCGGTCRRVFNNRRAVRGAALYDLFMMRDQAKDDAQRNRIDNAQIDLERKWYLEDVKAGVRKRTWQRPFNVFNAI